MRSRSAEALLVSFLFLLPLGLRAERAFDPVRDNFRLIDSRGKAWALSAEKEGAPVWLMAWSPQCPEAAELLTWARKKKGSARLVLLNSARPQNREAVNKLLGKDKSTRVLMDFSQTVSKGLGFQRSGDLLVLPQGAGVPASKPAGCALNYSGEGVTFSREVADALKRQCLTCHQPGRSEPLFPTLEKLKGWSAMNRQVLRTYSMPPGGLDYETRHTWPAFYAEDLSLILNWIENGSPSDAGGEALFEEMGKSSRAQVQVGKPDLEWEMEKADQIPASGGVQYAHRQFGPTTKDLYIRAAELDFNLRVTHHLAVYTSKVPYPNANKTLVFSEKDPGSMGGPGAFSSSYLAAMKSWNKIFEWGLNKVPRVAYEGTLYFIPKGTYVILEHHYQPNGRVESSRSKLSLYLDSKPEGKLLARKMILPRKKSFSIPPHAKDFRLVTRQKLKSDVSVFSFMTHGHFRHSGYRVSVEYPGGARRLLANVPYRKFDSSFEFKFNQPVFLPAGATVEFELFYDNSSGNELNPDPGAVVKNGPSLMRNEMDIGQLGLVDGRMPGAVDLKTGD